MSDEAIVGNCFQLSGIGIICELLHHKMGLAQGIELVASGSNLKWAVIARIHYSHIKERHKTFDEETLNYHLLKFETPDGGERFFEKIKKQEQQNIFHYILKPIGHEGKPAEKEILIIKPKLK